MLTYHEEKDSAYYTGPMEAGKRLAALNDSEPNVYRRGDGIWVVETDNTWGVGETRDEAWRYYLGGEFGPIDENYDEAALRAAIEEMK